MKLEEYQEFTRESSIYAEGDEKGVACLALGVAGEAGEVADKIKKMFRDKGGIDLKDESLILELGDVLWYVTRLADNFGYSLQEVMRMNVNKLTKRMKNDTIKGSGDER